MKEGVFFLFRLVRRLAVQKQDRLSIAASRAGEKLSNIRTVRLFNGEELEAKLFEKEVSVYVIDRYM